MSRRVLTILFVTFIGTALILGVWEAATAATITPELSMSIEYRANKAAIAAQVCTGIVFIQVYTTLLDGKSVLPSASSLTENLAYRDIDRYQDPITKIYYTVDYKEGENDPYYNGWDLADGGSRGSTTMVKVIASAMYDAPSMPDGSFPAGTRTSKEEFETFAYCATGACSNTYYQGIKWEYERIKGGKESITFVGRVAAPSVQFKEAVKKWAELRPPTNLKLTATGARTIKIEWQDNSHVEDAFIIERKTAGGGWVALPRRAQNATSYTDTGLKAGTQYWYRVKAYTNGRVYISKPITPASSPFTPSKAVTTKKANSTTLVVAETTSPPTLSTFTTTWTTEPLEDILNKLVSRDAELNYRDDIAQSWEVSEDGLVWTFTLKPGIMFHDGTPCDAEAVAWNIETMRDGGASSYLYSAVQDAVAVDPVTLKLFLKNAFPNLLYNVSNSFTGINSPTAVEKYGEDYGVTTVVGSGPYIFKEWVKGDHITLERNPDYTWGPSWMSNQGPAYFQTVIYKFIPEAVTKTMLLQAGEVDVVNEVDATAISAFKADQNVTVSITSGKRLIYMGLNVTKPPFDDVRVRQAMNYIVDRESITENVFHGAGLPAYNFLTPNVQPQVESPYTYDLQKAGTLLADAGWTKNADGILEKDGQQFAIVLWTESITDRVQIATVLQSEMAAVGIKATIQQFDSGSYGDMFKTGEQQAFIRLYGWDNMDILEWFYNSKRIARGTNKTSTDNSFLDFLFVKAEAMPTLEDRTFVYRLVHEYLLDQSAWVPIFYPAQVRAYRADLGGYNATLDHVYILDLYRK